MKKTTQVICAKCFAPLGDVVEIVEQPWGKEIRLNSMRGERMVNECECELFVDEFLNKHSATSECKELKKDLDSLWEEVERLREEKADLEKEKADLKEQLATLPILCI